MGKQETRGASGPVMRGSVLQGGGRAGLAEQGCGAAPGPGWPAQTLVGRVPGA